MNAVIVWAISLGLGYVVFEAGWNDAIVAVLSSSSVWFSFFLGLYDDARNS